jgi:hypothetical protein
MANLDAAFGFRPIGKAGGPYDGSVMRVNIPTTSTTTDVFVGDIVKNNGSSDGAGVPQAVVITAKDDVPLGVVTSFEPTRTNLALNYGSKGTDRYAQVALVGGGALFEVQADGVMEAADVGLNCDIVLGSGSTVTGLSGYELDASAVTTTSGDILQVVAFADRPDNDLTLTNAKVIVRFNDDFYKPDRTGV